MKTFTPKIGILAIVLILIISAVLMVSKRNESTSLTTSASKSPGTDSQALSAKAEKSAGAEVGDYYAGPSRPPLATGSAVPASKPPALRTYLYPGSTTKSITTSKLELESNASAETITAWYKKKIDDSKFNAKSYAQTNTNGDILNKLTAAKPGEKLDITIKKDQNTSKVSITVDRS